MDKTRERISLIFELTVMFLSFHKGFNLVSAAVVCAILASISGLEPSSVVIDPMYLKLVTVSSLCPLTLTSVLMPWGRERLIPSRTGPLDLPTAREGGQRQTNVLFVV